MHSVHCSRCLATVVNRFDRLLYLGINMDQSAKLSILTALTRKFALAADVNLNDLASRCPVNFTGADFYAVCSNALAAALKRRAAEMQEQIRAFLRSGRLSLECGADTLGGCGGGPHRLAQRDPRSGCRAAHCRAAPG